MTREQTPKLLEKLPSLKWAITVYQSVSLFYSTWKGPFSSCNACACFLRLKEVRCPLLKSSVGTVALVDWPQLVPVECFCSA